MSLALVKNALAQFARSSTSISSSLAKSAESRILSPVCNGFQLTQTRGRYIDWRMWRDVKRRRMTGEYYNERLRVNALRKNSVIPQVIKDIADKEIAALPRDSSRVRIVDRCVVTSKPRVVHRKWRLSRMVWRSLADYNKLSGVQRAMW